MRSVKKPAEVKRTNRENSIGKPFVGEKTNANQGVGAGEKDELKINVVNRGHFELRRI